MSRRRWLAAPLLVGLLTAAGCDSETDKRLSGNDKDCEVVTQNDLEAVVGQDLRPANGIPCLYENPDGSLAPKVSIVTMVGDQVDWEHLDGSGYDKKRWDVEEIEVDGAPAVQARPQPEQKGRTTACLIDVVLGEEPDGGVFTVSYGGERACERATRIASKVLAKLPE